ncbi:MAG TPA: glyoxalase/bleomycin resistance/extradiol dioxygenase family protein [Azospirillaceae bacterium]|nr:glyoxalase/bleomycin resistance/extradiol dioxygenase family protein [Azospirillaceae bacterium]
MSTDTATAPCATSHESAGPFPAVRGGVAPYLTVEGAAKAAEFYARALGAEQLAMLPVDEKGRTMHVHLLVNGNSVMMSDAYPEYGHPFKAPQGVTLHLQVSDVQAWWDRAVAAGMEVVLPLQDMFWGDRYGQLRDPFGHSWSLGAPSPKGA